MYWFCQVDINITKFGGQLPSLNTVIQFKGVERVQQAGGAIGRAYFDTIIEVIMFYKSCISLLLRLHYSVVLF